jgi:hypothetical protein
MMYRVLGQPVVGSKVILDQIHDQWLSLVDEWLHPRLSTGMT